MPENVSLPMVVSHCKTANSMNYQEVNFISKICSTYANLAQSLAKFTLAANRFSNVL